MKLLLNEYNVVPNIEERKEFSIVLNEDKLLYNNQEIQDSSKVELINSLIKEYKDSIIKLQSEPIQGYKGGRQQIIKVQFDNEGIVYDILGSTSNNDSVNLYSSIKEKITSIVEK